MTGGQGRDSRSFGQRSISSMFSDSRLKAGKSGNRGSPLPLNEFLSRKLEKRSSQNQGCQLNAGLTLEVKKKLETMTDTLSLAHKPTENQSSCVLQRNLACPRDPSWPLQKSAHPPCANYLTISLSSRPNPEGDDNLKEMQTSPDHIGVEHSLDINYSILRGQNEASGSECLNRERKIAESYHTNLEGRFGSKAEVTHLDGLISRLERMTPTSLDILDAKPVFRNLAEQSEPANIVLERQGVHWQADNFTSNQSGHQNFVDLTEDSEVVVRRTESKQGVAVVNVEGTDLHEKRKRFKPLGARTPMQTCPLCSEMVPKNMLQAHVESELDALEINENVKENAHGHPWQDEAATNKDMMNGRFVHFEQQNHGSRYRSAQSLLVLGDDPKLKRHTNLRHRKEKRTSVFNHYADGGGWWDEGAVGVDSEAVGSTSLWEGLGSMSFGSTL